jgi:hypothetical protein
MDGTVISTAECVCLKCDCGCTTVVFEKFDWDSDGEHVDYNISFQDDFIYGKATGLLERIKRAFKILTGKPVYYAEVSVNKERMKEFLKSAMEIVGETNE